MAFLMPTFVSKINFHEIEEALLDGVTELNFIRCKGIEPELYFDLIILIDEYEKTNNCKIKQTNINKKLRKLFKKLLFSQNRYDYE